jgi:hypothetical protein
VPVTTINQRLKNGWDIATALTTPGGRSRWQKYERLKKQRS